MRVVNCRRHEYTKFIGRPSPLSNPFVIGKDGTRAEVIQKFEAYARANENVLDAIKRLKQDEQLGCYCFPKECHGDVIIKLWSEANANASTARS